MSNPDRRSTWGFMRTNDIPQYSLRGYNVMVAAADIKNSLGPSFVDVQVLEDFMSLVSESWLRELTEKVLRILGQDGFSLLIADDELVTDLNRSYRGLDETTDVLSFSFQHWGAYHGEGEIPFEHGDGFVLPPGEGKSIGEVIVSYPQAVRQADEAGHSIEHELETLVVHGMVHLAGHDHEVEDEAVVMRDLENHILNEVSRTQAPGVR